MRQASQARITCALSTAENQELVAGKTAMRAAMNYIQSRQKVHLSPRWIISPYSRAPSSPKLMQSNAACDHVSPNPHRLQAVHIVHISNRYCVEFAANFKRSPKASITIETCPHYLFLTSADVKELGAIAKCAPPIRLSPHNDQLWERVLDGTIDIIGSDHSPAPPEMKSNPDFFAAWGGIAGVQSTLSILLTRKPELPFERIAALTSENVARRFKIPSKRAGLKLDMTPISPWLIHPPSTNYVENSCLIATN